MPNVTRKKPPQELLDAINTLNQQLFDVQHRTPRHPIDSDDFTRGVGILATSACADFLRYLEMLHGYNDHFSRSLYRLHSALRERIDAGSTPRIFHPDTKLTAQQIKSPKKYERQSICVLLVELLHEHGHEKSAARSKVLKIAEEKIGRGHPDCPRTASQLKGWENGLMNEARNQHGANIEAHHNMAEVLNILIERCGGRTDQPAPDEVLAAFAELLREDPISELLKSIDNDGYNSPPWL